MRKLFLNVVLLSAMGAPYPASAQDAFPPGSISFFESPVCPPGWVPYAPARGRTILPAEPDETIGGVVGTPIGPGESPAHAHEFDATVQFGSESFNSGGGFPRPTLFLDGGMSRLAGVTAPSDSNIPVLKTLFCQKTAPAVEGALPPAVTVFFDKPPCPEGWGAVEISDGRFLVGLPAEAQPATFGAEGPIQDLEDRKHSHRMAGSVRVPSEIIGTSHCQDCKGQDVKDVASSGRAPYRGEAYMVSSGLPYIQLLQCEKQGPAAPQLHGIVHAATSAAGPAAPGQLITVYGSALSGDGSYFAQLDSQGRVANRLGGVSVLFDEFPAPLFFVRQDQINVQVPYGIAGRASTVVRVLHDGAASEKFELPVAPAVPGLFAHQDDPTRAVVLHSDGTLNAVESPAKPGDIVVLFGTGEGQTIPPGEDGKPAAAPFPAPFQQLRVWIGGVEARTEFAAAAPGFVGLLQLSVRIPNVSGRVDVQLQIGSVRSQPGTILFAQ